MRPSTDEYTQSQEGYVDLIPQGNIIDFLTEQTKEMDTLLSQLPEERGNYRYAPGKWSLKEVIGHISDNERIMSYRLLRIARGDKTPLAGYDQDVLMAGAPFHSWSVADSIEDYSAARRSTLILMRGVQDEAWVRRAEVGGAEVSARAWAYIIAGHEKHHLSIIRERYLTK